MFWIISAFLLIICIALFSFLGVNGVAWYVNRRDGSDWVPDVEDYLEGACWVGGVLFIIAGATAIL